VPFILIAAGHSSLVRPHALAFAVRCGEQGPADGIIKYDSGAAPLVAIQDIVVIEPAECMAIMGLSGTES
jgi:hypothetical protein